MKKLLLSTVITLCSVGVYAQINELNCTERALTFKISLPAKRHNYPSKIERFETVQAPAGAGSSNIYFTKQNLTKAIFLYGSEEELSSTSFYTPDNINQIKKMTFLYPKTNAVTGKFNGTAYDHFKLLPMPVINTLSPLLN
ncbi:hypothetical protein MTO98_09340 [Mucilaginibacter sp. SMC90]|uniref:hypothetical protein n=1 Tax=Mucilaginibacter sp. SMC90 TaxID=2929803 RepID=UPI001FB20F6C|nr:hypothetical protein [Mucilaginibacter sp. SMC90]UOE51281.1 hypothetical protein MTO98_09340 [Mucilaginibacter sp. SMC90]